MTINQQQPNKLFSSVSTQGKTLISAIIGAIIGCGASLHIYYTLLGGSDVNSRIAQIELTVEHNRVVAEQTLATLKAMPGSAGVSGVHGKVKLSEKPTPTEFNQAINGLFDGLDATDAESAVQPAQTEALIEPKTANPGKQESPEAAGGGAENGSSPASDEAAGK